MEKRSMRSEKGRLRAAPSAGEEREKSKKRRELRAIFFNGVLFKNPMLVGALGIYPMLTACHTLRGALELSVVLVAMAVPAGLILCFTGNLVPLWARPGLAAVVAALLYIPASALPFWRIRWAVPWGERWLCVLQLLFGNGFCLAESLWSGSFPLTAAGAWPILFLDS